MLKVFFFSQDEAGGREFPMIVNFDSIQQMRPKYPDCVLERDREVFVTE